MRIEIIKTDKGFIIPQLEGQVLPMTRFFADAEIDDVIAVQGSAKQKSPTILALEKALAQVGSDPLLKMKLENLPPDYTYTQTKDDEEILYDALRVKYEL